jgi:hypothetical protein
MHLGSEERPLSRRRAWLHEIVFEANTPAAKSFEVGAGRRTQACAGCGAEGHDCDVVCWLRCGSQDARSACCSARAGQRPDNLLHPRIASRGL